MDDLRLVRRDDQSLIVATDTGEEYRLVVDEAVLGELRQLARLIERGGREVGRVNPRAVQSLVRAGKSRAEIAELTGVDEADIARYEEPVLAERRYMLELAHAVAVRTGQSDGEEEHFGTVIAERLVGLGARGADWSSWRDEEAGWMIALTFVSHEVDHRAVWSFDHRKRQLAPLNPDAETLSKQGEIGDRLIPKLRAVDANERFDSGAFDPERLAADADGDDDSGGLVSGPVAPDHPSTGSIPIVGFDAEAEFARRQNIEERAIKTPAPELPDLGQTADLLDALRRRRGEREGHEAPADTEADADLKPPVPLRGVVSEPDHDAPDLPATTPARSPFRAPEPVDPVGAEPTDATTPAEVEAPDAPAPGAETQRNERRKGRASIPSWDDILFGTRSDEDPV